MSGPEPRCLVSMVNAFPHYFERNFNSLQKVWTCKMYSCAVFTLVDLLNDSFQFRVFRIWWIDKVITRILGIFLFLAKIECVFVSFGKIFQAFIIDFVVKIRVYSSLIIEVKEPENVSSLHHDEAIQPGFTQMQKIMILFEENLFMYLLKEDTSIAWVRFAVIDDFSVSLGKDWAQPYKYNEHYLWKEYKCNTRRADKIPWEELKSVIFHIFDSLMKF